jgi:nickel-dependent lactate racemase
MLGKKAKNKNTLGIPYENSFIELPIFSNAEITELKPSYIESLNYQQILSSIKNPIDNAPIAEIAGGKKNVLIILENATRPLNTSFIASLVVDELRQAGVADQNTTFLFANGAHKDMEEYNYKEKLGSQFNNL